MGHDNDRMDATPEYGNDEEPRRRDMALVQRRRTLKGPAKCKTCVACRRKKIKCQPSSASASKCQYCRDAGLQCIFVEDNRRLSRPSGATIKSLEATVAGLLDQLQGARSQPLPAESTSSPTSLLAGDHVRLSPRLTASYREEPGALPPSTVGDYAYRDSHDNRNATFTDRSAPLHTTRSVAIVMSPPKRHEQEHAVSELSPQEAVVAGLYQDGTGFSVHGVSSIMHANPPAGERDGSRTVDVSTFATAQSEVQSRLVCNAALQRQREPRLFRTPTDTVDLDGLDPGMAKHLFDLHWNRQHHAYLLTYRPAIMDSIATGGRWCNKLLLNAIYYSSTVYSDRHSSVAPQCGGKTPGDYFYDRFRELLVDAIVSPTLPTAVALLLLGSNMASQGRLSAGWNFCGLAYRMILDLGLHLMASPAYPTRSGSSRLEIDIDREIQKRVYWGAFIIDSTQSLYFGRPTTLPLAEARVPQQLLDTYEELEEWMPYIDPSTTSTADRLLMLYTPQTAYAVSTFNALTRLFHICSRISGSFYSMSSLRLHEGRVLPWKQSLQAELSAWRGSLPAHLEYDPDRDLTPPPHQITLHTSYHVVTILLRRPFLDGGHLSSESTSASKDEDEMVCVNSALSIWQLVAAYRSAFTLRRAAYLLAYAIYSAIVVLLRHSKQDSEQRRQAILFFWTALSEQRQWFSGLQKPINLLRDLVDNFGASYILPYDTSTPNDLFNDMMEAVTRPVTPAPSNLTHSGVMADFNATSGFDDDQYFSFDFLTEQERIISDDPLYGLFAPVRTSL